MINAHFWIRMRNNAAGFLGVAALCLCVFKGVVIAENNQIEDKHWDTQFGWPLKGVHGMIYAVAVEGSHVYTAGYFDTVSGTRANAIAIWDGQSWSALGSGIDGTVTSIAVIGSDVIAGGEFTLAGGISVSNIARWDGAEWSDLGGGINGKVAAIAVIGSDVIAGGEFTLAGGVSMRNIARWDGAEWSDLGGGINEAVVCMTSDSFDLYAASSWFVIDGRRGARNISKWDGTEWMELEGTDPELFFEGEIYCMKASGGNLFIGGFFDNAGGKISHHIAKWDGTNWSGLGDGISPASRDRGYHRFHYVYAIAVSGTDVYAGGDFDEAGGKIAHNIAKWNGAEWTSLGQGGLGIDSPVLALAADGTGVYAGGYFKNAGGIKSNAIAKWEGSGWNAIPGMVDGSVDAIAISSGKMYVGGLFEPVQDGLNTVYNLAVWDGEELRFIEKGLDGWIKALAVYGNDVYAGVMNGNKKFIARWDGEAWSFLEGGLNGTVYCLAIDGNDVYAGGRFNRAGGITVSNIARWNGASWSSPGDGFNGEVYALAAAEGRIYAGGAFTESGSTAVNGIAGWDGHSWKDIGGGIRNDSGDASVYSIAIRGEYLYAGGEFTQAGHTDASNIARWNGASWSPLGSGVDNRVYAIALSGQDVYLGGAFNKAGGVESFHFARWHETLSHVPYIEKGSPGQFTLFQNYPNPGNPSTVIHFALPRSGRAVLRIVNMLGREVRVLAEGNLAAGNHTVEWDGRDKAGASLPSGVYLYMLQAEYQVITRKLMLLK